MDIYRSELSSFGIDALSPDVDRVLEALPRLSPACRLFAAQALAANRLDARTVPSLLRAASRAAELAVVRKTLVRAAAKSVTPISLFESLAGNVDSSVAESLLAQIPVERPSDREMYLLLRERCAKSVLESDSTTPELIANWTRRIDRKHPILIFPEEALRWRSSGVMDVKVLQAVDEFYSHTSTRDKISREASELVVSRLDRAAESEDPETVYAVVSLASTLVVRSGSNEFSAALCSIVLRTTPKFPSLCAHFWAVVPTSTWSDDDAVGLSARLLSRETDDSLSLKEAVRALLVGTCAKTRVPRFIATAPPMLDAFPLSKGLSVIFKAGLIYCPSPTYALFLELVRYALASTHRGLHRELLQCAGYTATSENAPPDLWLWNRVLELIKLTSAVHATDFFDEEMPDVHASTACAFRLFGHPPIARLVAADWKSSFSSLYSRVLTTTSPTTVDKDQLWTSSFAAAAVASGSENMMHSLVDEAIKSGNEDAISQLLISAKQSRALAAAAMAREADFVGHLAEDGHMEGLKAWSAFSSPERRRKLLQRSAETGSTSARTAVGLGFAQTLPRGLKSLDEDACKEFVAQTAHERNDLAVVRRLLLDDVFDASRMLEGSELLLKACVTRLERFACESTPPSREACGLLVEVAREAVLLAKGKAPLSALTLVARLLMAVSISFRDPSDRQNALVAAFSDPRVRELVVSAEALRRLTMVAISEDSTIVQVKQALERL